jgi:ABC-2 type transport system ATP-binding protein
VAALLELIGVEVRRGRVTVLRDVDLAVAAGGLLRVEGANGSGKTSLLRVLAGVAPPRRGRAHRGGPVAFVPEKVVLAGALRPREWLRAMAALRGADDRTRVPPGLETVPLDRPAGTLSKGTLQRLALAEALGAGAGALVLDEPFAGLDAGRLPDAGVVRLAGGRCTPRPHPAPGQRLHAAHPDGRVLDESVPEADVDARLRALLDEGWHIRELRP